MIELDETSSGVILSVKASAGARRNGFTGTHAGAIKISVIQPPEKGKANDAILSLLADQLDLKKTQIQLVAGPTSPVKKFLITGMAIDDLKRRLEQLIQP